MEICFLRRLSGTVARIFVASVASFIASPLLAQEAFVPILPNSGIHFEQISFDFQEVQQPNSAWARAVLDPSALAETSGMMRGFVNIRTPVGWVVQNWEFDLAEGPLRENAPGSLDVFYFQLFEGPPGPLTGVPAVIHASRGPVTNFSPDPETTFPVFFHIINAEGGGATPWTTIPAPPPPFPPIVEAGETWSHIQPNLANVEAAVNQCFPMSIANSLQYLENRYGLPVPNDHVPGLKGDNSLVGKLDTAADRTAPTRNSGSGTWFVPMVDGKFSYLNEAGLEDGIEHFHQGQGYGGAGNQLPDGNYSSGGITSTEQGDKVTWEWVCEAVKKGCDVEMVYSAHNAMDAIVGGHAFRVDGCGKTEGKPWIRYAHDGTQGNDSFGLETPQVYLEDLDEDGTLNFGAADLEVQFAFAECPTDAVRDGTFAPPQTISEAFVSAASFARDLAVSGLTTVFGLFNTVVNGEQLNAEGARLQALDRVKVLVNGREAPVFYADSRQINFQIPAETEEGPASFLVLVDDVPSDLVTTQVGGLAPGIFPIEEAIAGPNRGAIQNQDFTLNTPTNPAAPSSVLIVYMTGMGELNPPLATGEPASTSPHSLVVGSVEATVGGLPAVVEFAGGSPGFVGLVQVNVKLPALPAGEHEIVITVDGIEANRVQVSVGE